MKPNNSIIERSTMIHPNKRTIPELGFNEGFHKYAQFILRHNLIFLPMRVFSG